jgi:hypothetical protein
MTARNSIRQSTGLLRLPEPDGSGSIAEAVGKNE